MFDNNVIALEMLAANVKNSIGTDIEAWIQACRDIKSKGGVSHEAVTQNLIQLIRDKVGIKVEIGIVPDDLNVNLGMWSDILFFGHSGTNYYKNPELKVFFTSQTGLRLVTEIDLKTAKVKGGMANHLIFKIMISTGVLYDVLGFKVQETAAMFLHEVGHAFDTFMNLGEYVYLNYFLTEGIEVLQGKKPNKYKLELLDDTWLKKNLPEDQIDSFTNDRSEDNIRRAIMTTYKKAPRHHLVNSDLASKRRDEQMADNFVARLGYGRDLVVALVKMDKYYSNYTDRLYSSWMGQTVKLMLMVAFAPITAFMIAFNDPLDDRNQDTRYDPPLQRLMKIRRDLIQQLKIVKSVANGKTIVDDIDAIEVMLKEYGKDSDVFDMALKFFRPNLRKQRQGLNTEQDLELLINNDLFVNAFKLKSL